MKKFISVGMLLFPSKGDQKMWLEKWDTFYSPKAIEFLKKNGQLNQRILLEKNNELIRTIVIWEYESEEAYKNARLFIPIGLNLKIILLLSIKFSELKKYHHGCDIPQILTM